MECFTTSCTAGEEDGQLEEIKKVKKDLKRERSILEEEKLLFKGFMEKEKQQFKAKMQTDKEEIERGKKSL